VDAVTLEQVLTRARDLGFLGPGPVDRHVDHATRLVGLVGEIADFLDLGSGGGVPGLVVGAACPDASGVLLDAGARRCEFLESAILSLGLDARLSVVCGRAEDLARERGLRARFPLVLARGFGAPPVVAECGVGFLASGGRLIVTEPPSDDAKDARAQLERRWPAAALQMLGFGAARYLRDADVGAVELALEHPVEERWPRRTGVPTKRPLWEVATTGS